MSDLETAGAAIEAGDLVVYPTETVYGLAANALDPAAVDRLFALKGRDRSKPVSIALSSVEDALTYVDATDREREFMRAFLPGPVTVLCARRESIPDAVTGGRERVGVRVPDCDLALALCERVAPLPITATSANRSGEANARRVADLDPAIRETAVVLDGGETPGGESTVVDVSSGTILRRGEHAGAIERWLAEH
ncbi:L-threonylcarbamoyladenylate synthase [Natronobiforma cellulositropha]|uniref:L-threonylcarbamoyladenylate synthase n=1 Tax=Natronobiforma cellulositropha TaxID=1679076 RepID=UPI0021D5D80E|nr:L-threonylcarbamoyladenylate synthase [Natronobiforma cellulositropha]